MVGERDVLPGAAGGVARAAGDLEPRGFAELRVLGAVIGRLQRAFGEVGDREVRDRVAPGLEQQDGVVALHDGPAAELGAHAAPQRLGVEHPFRHAGYEELSAGIAT